MLNVIVNPKVRRVDRLVAELGRRFQEAGADHRFFYSSKQGNAIKYAHSLTAAGQTQIVVVGGDGTLNEVLSGIVEPARVSLGIIPAGTGNDFAETARIPFGVRAADLILQTEPVPTDYIECGARRSLNIAGTGIDVEILRRCERMRGSKKGKYLRSLIATLFRYRGCTLTVTADGASQEVRAMIAAVCNGSRLGGGIPLCPVAKIDDGLMELVFVDCPRRSRYLPALLRLMRGKLLEQPIAHRISCREAEIVSPQGGLFVQYDGEILQTDALRARLVAGGIRIWRGEL